MARIDKIMQCFRKCLKYYEWKPNWCVLIYKDNAYFKKLCLKIYVRRCISSTFTDFAFKCIKMIFKQNCDLVTLNFALLCQDQTKTQ